MSRFTIKEGEDFNSAVVLCEGASLDEAVDKVAANLRKAGDANEAYIAEMQTKSKKAVAASLKHPKRD